MLTGERCSRRTEQKAERASQGTSRAKSSRVLSTKQVSRVPALKGLGCHPEEPSKVLESEKAGVKCFVLHRGQHWP